MQYVIKITVSKCFLRGFFLSLFDFKGIILITEIIPFMRLKPLNYVLIYTWNASVEYVNCTIVLSNKSLQKLVNFPLSLSVDSFRRINTLSHFIGMTSFISQMAAYVTYTTGKPGKSLKTKFEQIFHIHQTFF